MSFSLSRSLWFTKEAIFLGGFQEMDLSRFYGFVHQKKYMVP